jgi:hypothetical protein
MIKRLGLVIHWLGFIIGIGSSLFLASVLFNEGIGIAFSLGVIFFVVFHLVGWAVRYILTGNKSIFPWKS